jgi:hypothetical protein
LFYCLDTVVNNEAAKEIINKYGKDNDKLRWSLKPILMKHLLSQQYTDRLIYLDNDLYFYSDYTFLFELLEKHSFLLTPHHYKNNPNEEQNWLEANFRIGLYNAGFVGANKYAINTLQWWADCCLYRCEKNSFRGLFDDQKYLDIIPVIEETAHIVRHMGCNIAGWNTELCKREIINQQILINGLYPIVFIHFNDTTIREIISGKDQILYNYYSVYITSLKKYKNNIKRGDIYFKRPLIDKLKFNLWKYVTELGI